MPSRHIKKSRFLLRKKPAIYGLILFIIFAFLTYPSFKNIKTPLKNYFSHSWRSIKKLPNIAFLSFWFKQSDLPLYHVFIDIQNVEKLNNSVPVDLEKMDYGFLSDSNKNYVNAYFAGDDGYQSKIKIRYRGLMQNHWQAEQKSLKIKFPSDNLFQGMRELNLIIPLDRGYFVSALNSYRAEKMGVLAPDIKFVRLNINKRDFGVYLASEAWSTEFLDKNGIADTDNILSNNDTSEAMSPDGNKLPFSYWKSYTAGVKNENGPFEELDALRELVAKAPDEVFYKYIDKLVDLEKIYKWQLVTVLSGSAHQSDSSNLVLLFRRETGKFEPIVWDIELEELKDKVYNSNQPLLVKRIFKNKVYSDKFLDILKNYVQNEDNLTNDLNYYDSIVASTKNEFYSDQAKNENNFSFNRANSKSRELIVKNFQKAGELVTLRAIKESHVPESLSYSSKLNFSGSFKYLPDVIKSVNQFIAENPQFKKVNEKTVVISAGSHIFYKTVVVPSGLRLVIEPGAQLLFNPGVSLVSYGSVTADGDSRNQILMAPSYPSSDKPWGVFAVVNTGSDKNYFSNIIVSGGSSDLINGVNFLSQFSLHNAESLVENSVFKNGKSDDGFHAILGSIVIRNSLFENNSSDGMDLDFISNGKVENSRFINNILGGNNGDAIDLSGTRIEIVNNQIAGYGDKCISVGEKSSLVISGNIIAGCNTGIAVKDFSDAVIDNNKIIGNKSHGLYLYRKKPSFINGGKAQVSRSVIWGNPVEIEKDEFSSLIVNDSIVEGGYEGGTAISQIEPELSKILPANIYNLVFNRNKNE
ncbi:MAG: hypothetical protein A3B91_01235 [Candidatus Yanofskybacteria bacterium RIFCSPHIGHO2_02_FULL_41_29]|uniref:Right handed beta helix domain-containing protein n=1 Tax=Candidatus Yanofskybacteria bacterium RIFCSPHIGHO2_01_FULL_41_53 TaxID=1802663 RepID=A0A1F8EJ71_9BACT|nr:MAG: hypothetical protein A2650_02095 [Candidatus Yanofskybacteria bacterium RIFCSPHIGHO2_01_FULL_41_53]OGN10243.1 MAG: hypothetical protein A3B91_01235 [Candidatus Yanofskybacteria bacterium RIFCSPHIGHO2_02_FULL_41_29]OGN21778.1 MAG: hypothetical protein A2916_03605 [Candidatus Yanofskybacteria bacterium RIFCSPLOWO2_01_FULL_41_67]OGN30453.1 MAG: hypothetical protein A3H54_00280 [Candidatus Yanofskybacteria bacterium RIFCSPLOWO2_02_FULL_41_13]OGN34375.1 MAG: hypothetical protein A3F98_01795 